VDGRQHLSRRDYPVVQGGLLLIAAIVMVVNLTVDVLYGAHQSAHSSQLNAEAHSMSISDKSAVVVVESRNATRKMLAEFWFYFSQNRGAVAGLVVFIALVIVALFAPLVAPHDPDVQYRDFFLTPPVWQEGGNAMFLLGTDAVGRDMLSRLIFGARFSLFIGLVVVGIALTGGIVIGVIAGYFRGWVDTVIMRVMDVILAFPSLLLALVLVAVLGPG
jgi:dipeptide transport system permease protein